MECKKMSVTSEQLLDPAAVGWTNIAGEALTMDATPLANQPSEYIKASRDERKIGKVRNLLVQTVHNGKEIFFRLSWEDASKDSEVSDITTFLDGCGVLMPLKGGDPPIDEMGSKDAPVNAWFWRADFEEGTARNTTAEGLGTTQYSERSPLKARGLWGQGAWAVVFARPLAVPELEKEMTQLAPGATVKVGFAVWEGANGERAGVKAFSKEWRDLTLDA